MGTERTIFTGLNKKSFDTGFQWVRATKQPSLNLLVIDMGLEEGHVDELKDLGVKVIANNKTTGVEQVDLFNTFLMEYAKDSGTYLFWDMEVKAKNVASLWDSSLFAVPLLKKANIPSLVLPLAAINARVKFGSRLEGGLCYYSGLMSGRLQEWQLFVGWYNTLIITGTVESLISARDIVLNIFALYFTDRVEAKPVEYEIFTLQPENLE